MGMKKRPPQFYLRRALLNSAINRLNLDTSFDSESKSSGENKSPPSLKTISFITHARKSPPTSINRPTSSSNASDESVVASANSHEGKFAHIVETTNCKQCEENKRKTKLFDSELEDKIHIIFHIPEIPEIPRLSLKNLSFKDRRELKVIRQKLLTARKKMARLEKKHIKYFISSLKEINSSTKTTGTQEPVAGPSWCD